MFTLERQQQILDTLKEKKSASVSQLSKQFFIGEATIRRDLQKLEAQKLVKRTYGGVVLVEGPNAEIPLSVREKEQSYAKDVIGKMAAELIGSGETIILDSSSTTYSMIKHLKSKENLTLLTNGLKTASELGVTLHTKVYCTGGRLRENSLSLVGSQAAEFLRNYAVEKLFFSCRALSVENGAMDNSEEEAELRKQMMRSAEKVILLCDSRKFGTKAFYKVCDFDKIHIIITDRKPNTEFRKLFEKLHIQLIYP